MTLNAYDAKTFNRKIGNIKRNTGRVRETVEELWPHAMFYAAGLNGNANTDYLTKLMNTVTGTNVGGIALTTQIKIASKQVLDYVTFGKTDGKHSVKAKGWAKMSEADRREAIDNMQPLFTYEKPETETDEKPLDVKAAIDRLISRLDKADKLSDRELFHKLRALIGEDVSNTVADENTPDAMKNAA